MTQKGVLASRTITVSTNQTKTVTAALYVVMLQDAYFLMLLVIFQVVILMSVMVLEPPLDTCHEVGQRHGYQQQQ